MNTRMIQQMFKALSFFSRADGTNLPLKLAHQFLSRGTQDPLTHQAALKVHYENGC